MTSTNELLDERGKQYNKLTSFADNAETMQELKEAIRQHRGWYYLDPDMCEVFDMVLHKMVRVLAGDSDPDSDSIADMIGYLRLIQRVKE